MKYSIIIPVYNSEDHLERCLESVIHQSYSDWELILIDDGSLDSSGIICDQYHQLRPTQVQVIHQENSGVFITRRLGIAEARGEFLCFLDSDDYWDPNFLEDMERLQNQYDPDIIFFGYRTFGRGNTIIEEHTLVANMQLYFGDSLISIYEYIIRGKISSLWTGVYRRNLSDLSIDYSQFSQVFKGEDLLQNLAFVDRAKRILCVPEVYYSYFINETGLSKRKLSIQYIESHVIVQNELMKYATKWNVSLDEARQLFIGVLYAAIKSLLVDKPVHSSYSLLERKKLLNYLISGDCGKYLDTMKIRWDQKTLGFFLFLLQHKKMKLVFFLIPIFRILNILRKGFFQSSMRTYKRKEVVKNS
ncbi:glycosyltransferase family 2 protein [Sphaerochaeta sp.]|uniref:glycosyltransferase family 2 protein n=1 Tax=Sphaerochaeta sp. TaxID=1972642 RepID=UPI002FC5B702